ncbi:MAG: uncharacterized protein KVP18_002983 [Porospora cf. gigantea A]|nr:MAG: hypothetical protein KVP18_002983 [Porospora cf. gigantea A]
MSLLLALLEMGALSDAEDMKHLVVLLVLTYFGESYVASSSPNLDALRYCLVVHALSVIRCIALDSFHKRSARRHDLDILRLQRHVVLCRTHAVCGFCVYMNMMGFDASVSGPLSSAFELGKDMSVAMQDTGLWPLFLNPMMLAGERWSDVKDRTPFKGYDLHPSIANTRFPSRMRLLSFDVEDAADRAAVVASELVSMRQPDRDQKGTRHAVKSSRPLTFSKLTLDELHPQDLFLGLHRTISTQNLIHQPDSWLAAIPDPDETSRLRCSMAVAVSRGVAGCLNILRKAQDQMWHDTAKHAEAFCFCPLSLQRPQEKRPILNLVLPYVGGHVPSSDVIRPLLDVFSASLRIPPESTMTQEENNPCQVHGNAEALARIRKLYQSRKQRVSESNGASENCRNDNSTKSENPKKERARLSKKEDGRRSKNKKQPRSVKPKNSQPWTLTVIHEEQNLDEPVKVQELEIVESSTAGRRTKIDRARATNRPVLLTSVLARASTSRSLTIGCVEARRLGSYTC